MFATAGAKSVGRNELQSPELSPRSSPDPDLTELLRSRTRDHYDFTNTETFTEDAQEEAAANEEEVDLILFAAPANSQQSHKIRLSSPDAADGEPGLFLKKPHSYYFADEVTSEKEEEFSAAALTGAEVMELSKTPWPGCAVPWKVRRITATGMKKAVLVGHPPTLVTVEETEHKRRRKGKKSRLALRKKVQAAKEKSDHRAQLARNRAQLAQEKEEAEREKRTRRNREKKVKKKARELAKKAGDADIADPTKAQVDQFEETS